jgi:hypothetical protein
LTGRGELTLFDTPFSRSYPEIHPYTITVMNGDVIQGFFPSGVSHLARAAAVPSHVGAAARPAWVQQRIAPAHATAQRTPAPHAVHNAVRATPNGTAFPLPPQFARVTVTGGGEPLAMAVRQKMEALFHSSFADVRVHVDQAPQSLGALAFTHGSHIHFAPGQYNVSTAQGQQLLGHELAHVVQQRTSRVRNPFGSGTAVVHDAALEAEAHALARRAGQMLQTLPATPPRQLKTAPPPAPMRAPVPGAHRAAQIQAAQLRAAQPARPAAAVQPKAVPLPPRTIQPLIVNVGDDALSTELAKDVGWIVASDIDVALQRGGEDQAIIELGATAGHGKIDAGEDIYLVGHGDPGRVGATLPRTVATALKRVIPGGYQGTIRSLSCSTGAPHKGTTAVAKLHTALNGRGRGVTGASGIALNHSAYESGTRVVKGEYDRYVGPEIDRTIGSVNDDWKEWVQTNGVGDLKKAALIATVYSMNFYERLQRRVRQHLLPEEETITNAPAVPTPEQYPQGMVRPGERRRKKKAKKRQG